MPSPARLVPLAALALMACQPASPEPEVVTVDPAVLALTNACLAEIGQPPLPATVASNVALELEPGQQEAFAACVQRRGAG